MRSLLVASILVLAGCLGAPATPPPEAADPCAYPCAIEIDPDMAYVREPMVAASPSDPLHLVVAAQDNGPLGDSWDVAEVSRDGGATWTRARLPGGPNEAPTHPLVRATKTSDPIAVVLRDGTVVYAGLASLVGDGAVAGFAAQGVSLFVARSEDGGLTYPEVTVVAEQPGATGFVFFPVFQYASVLQDDKPWMAVGPADEVLLVWSHHVASPARSEVVWSVSTDAGRTWSAPTVIEDDEGVFWGVSPAIAPDGTWHVAYVAGGQDAEGFSYALRVASSADAGATWAVVAVDGVVPFQAPQLAVDATAGRLVLAYVDGPDGATFGDAVLTTSSDRGVTWSAPDVFAAGDGTDAQLSLAVAPDGAVRVALWATDAEGVSERRLLTPEDASVPPLTLGSGAVSGDYAGLVAWDGGTYAVWPRWSDGVPTLDGMGLAPAP